MSITQKLECFKSFLGGLKIPKLDCTISIEVSGDPRMNVIDRVMGVNICSDFMRLQLAGHNEKTSTKVRNSKLRENLFGCEKKKFSQSKGFYTDL